MNIRIIVVFIVLIAVLSVPAFAGTTITADTPAVESVVTGNFISTPAVGTSMVGNTAEGYQVIPIGNTVATGASKTDLFFAILPWLITLLTMVLAVIKARKDGKTWSEALHIAVNTMKVEDKMDSGAFKPELVQKVGVVSEALQASAEAKEKVEKILREGREVDDIKIASINGKKIYLGDLTGIGSALAAAINRIRKIRL